eukprot:TRINITY_DN9433_c0_g1_i1.p2 TRINITY_DN9433_c0_g1~~TRINITY_DN9433_c0_g1_i1.p2  ORF type:complete len:128 (+),score=18.92 TRINITY_DN9433_c0_g1_i1:52-435(+)
MDMRACLLLKDDSDDRYKTAIEAAGYTCSHVNILEKQDELNELRKWSTDDGRSQPNGIIFTSATAVKVCSGYDRAHESDHLARRVASLPIYVVGKATAEAVRTWLGVEVIVHCPRVDEDIIVASESE